VSAAPVAHLSAPDPFPTKIRGPWARTRASDIGVLRNMSQSETGCLTLIHVESIGWGHQWTRTSLLVKRFADHSNTDPRPCQDSLKVLEQDGLLERRKSKTGKGWEYRRVQPIDYTGPEAVADCPDCKKRTRFTLDRDVPIPHSLFLKVQQAVDHGTFMAILLIAIETLRWKEGQIWVHPKEIKIDEIARRLDRSKSEVEADLKKAEGLGAIGSYGNRGAIQTFWVLPNAWETLKPRPRRTGGNPKPFRKAKGEDKAKQDRVSPIPEKKEDKPKTSPVEFWNRPCGRCNECGYQGPVERLYEVENTTKKPLGSANRPHWRARGAPINEPRSTFSSFLPNNYKKEA
jgi:hypothetical protein